MDDDMMIPGRRDGPCDCPPPPLLRNILDTEPPRTPHTKTHMNIKTLRFVYCIVDNLQLTWTRTRLPTPWMSSPQPAHSYLAVKLTELAIPTLVTAMLVTESEIMVSGLLSLRGLGLSVSWAPGLDGDATPPVPVGVCVSNYTAQSSPVLCC